MSESEVEKLKGEVARLNALLERKEAELKSIKQSRVFPLPELFEAFLTSIPDRIYFKDLEGRFTRVNPALVEHFNCKSEEELLGKSDQDFFDEKHHLNALQDERQIIQTGEPILDKEELEIHLDGTENWVLTTKMPLKDADGNIVGTCGLSRNITKIKKSEEQLQSLMDNIPERIYFKDTESKFVIVNRACAREMGFENPADVIGKTDMDFFDKTVASEWMEEERSIVQGEKPLIFYEALEQRNDGREAWVSVSKIPWKNNRGDIVGVIGITHDITNVKSMEQKLSTLMDNIPDSIYFKNLKSEFVLVNKGCASGFHLNDPADALGKTDFDFFDPIHAKPSYDDEQMIIKTGVPIIGKEEFEKRNDGRETWVSSTKMPWRDSKGNIIGTFGLSRDITKIKVIEEQLVTLMDTVPDSIYFKDHNSRFVLINQACARSFKLISPDDAIGLTDFDIFSEKHSREAFEDEKKVMESGEAIIGKEELESWNDGSERWVSTTKMPWRDKTGKVIGVLGVSRDVTQIKKAEMELKCLMEFLPDSIYFKDRAGKFTQVSRSKAMKHNLKDPKEAIGKTDFDFFSRERAQHALMDEEKIMREGTPLVGKEDMEVLPDGTKKWTSTTKVPLRDHHGNITGTFGLSRDVTKMKLAEEALQISNDRLERKVQKRTEELSLANKQMERHIEQLNYLNQKAHFFAQLIDKETLLSAIYFSFVELFPKGQVHIVEYENNQFKTLYNTPGLLEGAAIYQCLDAIKFYEPRRNQQITFVMDWRENSLLADIFQGMLENFPCYMVVPLIANRRLRGAVQIFMPSQSSHSFDKEKAVINTLASQAAISLDNAFHYQELGRKTRIQSELEIAHGIQDRYTPKDPQIPGFKIKGVCKPANEVGGDYLDFFQNEEGNWVITIADVCGKGIPAALVMTSLRSIVRVLGLHQSSSKEILAGVNEFMGIELQRDKSFITCMCLVIDKSGRYMNYTRAGHPMLVNFGPHREKPEPIPSSGLALGMIAGDGFKPFIEEVHVDLIPGDKFLAYTDGLDEAMNPNKETYGQERLFKVLESAKEKSPEQAVNIILSDVESYVQGQSQYDDLTLFVLERI